MTQRESSRRQQYSRQRLPRVQQDTKRESDERAASLLVSQDS